MTGPPGLPVRVVLADDHPMFRYGVSAVLATADEIELVGEATTGRELVDLVERLEPDVVLTDLAMHDDDGAVLAALRAGARGYLLKGVERAELLRAILAVAAGDAVYGAPVATRIVDFYTGAQQKYSAAVFPELTARERDVLELLADGRPNSHIARQLGMTDKTVRNHISAILAKLHVPDRTAAAVKARNAGLGR
jgi:DNA-binding NarL/FixJ family response regulator